MGIEVLKVDMNLEKANLETPYEWLKGISELEVTTTS